MGEPRYEIIDRHALGGSLIRDDSVVIGRRTSIDTCADVTMHAGVEIAEDVLILTHVHTRGHGLTVSDPLVIGKRVTINARAIILPQVNRIGKDAIIGAGAVVTKDVPAGETWAGNPARRIR